MIDAVIAALPIAAVLVLMLVAGWPAVRAGAAGLALALVLAVLFFPFESLGNDVLLGIVGALAEAAFTTGAIIWIILPALAIYRLQNETGAVERAAVGTGGAVARPSPDRPAGGLVLLAAARGGRRVRHLGGTGGALPGGPRHDAPARGGRGHDRSHHRGHLRRRGHAGRADGGSQRARSAPDLVAAGAAGGAGGLVRAHRRRLSHRSGLLRTSARSHPALAVVPGLRRGPRVPAAVPAHRALRGTGATDARWRHRGRRGLRRGAAAPPRRGARARDRRGRCRRGRRPA